MPVTVTHKEWDARQEEWETLGDVLAGRAAVIDAGERYVPKLGGQTPAQYTAYLTRGMWGGFTARTRDGIVGLVFSQEPQIEVPSVIEPLLEDVTLSDMNFGEFAKAVFTETVTYGWGGILVDVNPLQNQTQPQDDRPYLTHYGARSVRWWQREKLDGKWKTTTVILEEQKEVPVTPAPEDPGGEYGTQTIPQFRVLKLRPEQSDDSGDVLHVYRQEIWQEVADTQGKKTWAIVDTIMPLRGGAPLTEIPWTFAPVFGLDPHIEKSPLLDVAEVNLDHWRMMVDIRHGGHFTALPTPCASGVPSDDLELSIGAESAWAFSNPDFKTWYLEFSGSGLGFVRGEVEADERLMAVLGARLLETQKRAAETAEAMTLRQAGEQATVMTIALSVSKALEKALWWMAWWRNVEAPVVSVSLTSALIELQLTTEDLRTLFAALQAGRISEQTWLEALVRKQLVKGRTWEDEQALVAEAADERAQEAAVLVAQQGPPEPPGQRMAREENNREGAA